MNRVLIRALTAAAIAVAGLGAIAIDPGLAEATGAGGGSCLATEVFDQGRDPNRYDLYLCVSATKEECTAWTERTAAAVGGHIIPDTCKYVEAGVSGWSHPAGFYGAVTLSK
ncbi:hypothetical protein [Nocardia fusca]|uniref:Uncharacterized protein n=1 Tax=Nocardia fusca TaxID=941183 RepID=A0ABV3FKJ6_9NOCA